MPMLRPTEMSGRQGVVAHTGMVACVHSGSPECTKAREFGSATTGAFSTVHHRLFALVSGLTLVAKSRGVRADLDASGRAAEDFRARDHRNRIRHQYQDLDFRQVRQRSRRLGRAYLAGSRIARANWPSSP